MKQLVVLFVVLGFAVAAGQTPVPASQAPAPTPPAAPAPTHELLQVGVVYILPMSLGYDQFLANRLTRAGVVQVTSDPAKADAILADRLGKPLELKLDELYPKAAPAEEAAKPASSGAEAEELAPVKIELKGGRESTSPAASGGRGRGNIFLLHRGSRNVIWSTFVPPSSGMAKDLDHAAGEVAERLQDSIKKLKKLSMQAPGGN